MRKLTGAVLLAWALLTIHFSLSAMQPLANHMELLNSPTHLRIEGAELVMAAEPYLNLMPRVIVSPNEVKDCQENGSLIIPIRLNLSALPLSVQARKVWVHAKGHWWEGRISRQETRNENGHLVLLARGCPNSAFRPKVMLDVILELQHVRETHYLRSPPIELAATH